METRQKVLEVKEEIRETFMVQNILDYLEATAADCPDKPAFEDLNTAIPLHSSWKCKKDRKCTASGAAAECTGSGADGEGSLEPECIYGSSLCRLLLYVGRAGAAGRADPHDSGYAGGRGHRYQRKAVRESCCPWIHW